MVFVAMSESENITDLFLDNADGYPSLSVPLPTPCAPLENFFDVTPDNGFGLPLYEKPAIKEEVAAQQQLQQLQAQQEIVSEPNGVSNSAYSSPCSMYESDLEYSDTSSYTDCSSYMDSSSCCSNSPLYTPPTSMQRISHPLYGNSVGSSSSSSSHNSSSSSASYHRGKWSTKEITNLNDFMQAQGANRSSHNEGLWRRASEHVGTRSPSQCCKRWNDSQNPKIRRGKWTTAEQERLLMLRQRHGKNWEQIAKDLGNGRTPAQVREHYCNVLDSRVAHGKWTEAEDQELSILYSHFPDQWSEISKRMTVSRRTDYQVKKRCLVLKKNERL